MPKNLYSSYIGKLKELEKDWFSFFYYPARGFGRKSLLWSEAIFAKSWELEQIIGNAATNLVLDQIREEAVGQLSMPNSDYILTELDKLILGKTKREIKAFGLCVVVP